MSKEAVAHPDESAASSGDDEPSPSSADRGPVAQIAASWARISLLLALTAIAVRAFNLFEITSLWDDAYIFQRYAQNLLAGHGLSWHPAGEPTYGLTALLYIIPATLGRVVAGGNPSLGAILASTVCGAAFVGLTLRLLWTHTDGSVKTRAAATLLFLFCVAWSATPDHFASGMDTHFALSYLAILLIVAHRFEQVPNRRRAVVLGIVGGLAFWVRPELTSFGLAIPAAMLAFESHRDQRKLSALALAIVGAVLGLIALTNWAYFASVLPLPFYGKSMGRYGGALRQAYQGVAGQGLVEFIGYYWPLFLIVGLETTSRRRFFWRHAPPLDKAVLAATLVCLSYYWLLALPIMGMSQRFYQPAVVGLAFLAARTLGRWEKQLSGPLRSLSPAGWSIATCAALLALWATLMPKLVEEGKIFSTKISSRRFVFDPMREAAKKKDGPRSYWFKLDEFAKLPDDLVIATTEVGFLSAINPHKRIIDLAGLNDRAFAHRPFDPELLLGRYRPDLIYMPHEDYKTITEALVSSPQFANYRHLSKYHTRTRKFGVAIRLDSPHFEAMNALCDRRSSPSAAAIDKLRSYEP